MRFRVNAFESQYRENAPRRRYAAPKSNAFALTCGSVLIDKLLIIT